MDDREGTTELVDDPNAASLRQGTTELVDLNAPTTEPVTDPLTGLPVPEATPATPEQEQHARTVLSDPVKAIMEPGFADSQPAPETPQGGQPPMQPGHADGGHADLYPNEVNQTVNVLRPGTAGGFMPHSKTIEGIAPEAAKPILAQQGNVNEARRSAEEEANAAQQKYVDYVNEQATRQYQDNQAADLANAAEIARNQMVQGRIQDKMDAVSKFKPDRQQLFEGTAGGFRALGAVIGMLFGGALSGLNGGPNQAQEAVFKMIDQNAQDQIRTNSLVYDQLKQRLGDEQAAAIALRQKHLEYAKNIIDAQALGRGAQAAQAALGGAKQRIELEIQNANLQMMEKLAPHEKLALAHVAPTPTQILTLDKQEMMLKQYGMTPEKREKLLTYKMDEKHTVNDAIEDIKSEQRDVNMLKAIKEEYGGTLPGAGQAIDPTRSHFVRSLMARMGYSKATDAAQVYAKIEQAALERAKSYGRVTEYEVDSAKKQMGETPDQIIQFMQDNVNHLNARVSGVANAFSGGNGQHVLDILSAGIAGTPGIRTQGVTPRE